MSSSIEKKYPQFTSVQCLYPQFTYVIFIYSQLFIHHLTGFIWNQHKDQLPVGMLALLVEHCTGIVEVMGPNPVQADNIFRALFSQLLK